ncbi:hypothetical protein [Spiroplasma melliferum]|uniref:Transmembrane protein n=2 Tax=Spiroplasma melliferum TaxID=2134 RepID=A0AAI9T350_SPIME|nr:hypothetical protein [Spiroplasma melliferum]ELL44247.1 hypothetical protein SMIPMB4A_v3c8100 [Spiroplasma melliferum IPMB4A]KAI92220.1 hypothetical protein SPM_005675 [Spiroplasma melliferum KC3]QCO23638.1 putative transmembrane protein [Spiroplasma melliferum]
MKSFGKWSITLIWVIVLIILVLALVFLGIYYDGYYWEGKGLPVNINDIKTFNGNGYQLITQLGIGKLMRLVSSGSFIWGYSNIVVPDGGQGIDLMTWLQQPGNVNNSGVIQWPQNYELEAGTNFAEVVGSLLIVLLVAIPVLILIGIYVTKKMIKAMTHPYSIEYLDTQKKLKKTIKGARKALKKMNKAVRKGRETPTTLAREQERWANLIVNAEADFIKEKELFKTQDNKKPVVKKLVPVGKK